MQATKINIITLWGVVVGTLTASLWVFTNIAWAADVERIEIRLIKRDLREMRHELEHEHDDDDRRRLEQFIQEAIDDLCEINPDDRECK